MNRRWRARSRPNSGRTPRQPGRKNLQGVFTKLELVDQVEGGDPDNKGNGEKETSSENSDTEEGEEIN